MCWPTCQTWWLNRVLAASCFGEGLLQQGHDRWLSWWRDGLNQIQGNSDRKPVWWDFNRFSNLFNLHLIHWCMTSVDSPKKANSEAEPKTLVSHANHDKDNLRGAKKRPFNISVPWVFPVHKYDNQKWIWLLCCPVLRSNLKSAWANKITKIFKCLSKKAIVTVSNVSLTL